MILKMPDRQFLWRCFFVKKRELGVFRILFVLVAVLVPMLARGAMCPAGQYLVGEQCKTCATKSYCPGDDGIYECENVWQGGVTGVSFGGVIGMVGVTSAEDCLCTFIVPGDETAYKFKYNGKCVDGPTDYVGVYYTWCKTGYYAQGANDSWIGYQKCVPCTNAPNGAVYTAAGAPEKNDCGWRIVGDDSLCGLGYTKLNTSTGVSVLLYANKRTTPSINIGDVNGACYADLAPGRATGAINIMYNGVVYHTLSSKCDIGYWLGDDGTCKGCDMFYYCPGDNTRVSCENTIIEETGFPRPVVYSEGRVSYYSAPESCMCRWLNLSDERRANYSILGECYLGAQSGDTYVYYSGCNVGYYAIGSRGFNNWYRDCAPCTNGPANSHYTSYSTPSVMYAVESNCPWECGDGYVRTGDACVSE